MRDSALRRVPPGRSSALAGLAVNPKLPKINARESRDQAGVGGKR